MANQCELPTNAELDPAQARELRGRGVAFIDVRTVAEWDTGRIPGAVHVPLDVLTQQIDHVVPDPTTPFLCYCARGVRSRRAVEMLHGRGYVACHSIRGGLEAWRAAGLAYEGAFTWSPEAFARYQRQFRVREVGEAGQALLAAGRVAIIGAGGLGCPAALYLAAAGVGRLRIIDDDRVELSNLHRQILHPTTRVGQPKSQSAQTTLTAINPEVVIEPVEARLTEDTIDRLLADIDCIVDGSDNFATRYLLNDWCLRHPTPLVHGSVERFSGQVAVFWPGRGPCYRCLYPQPPPPEFAPSCAEAGVIGVVPGVVGVLQATEAIKVLLGIGETLVGRLLCVDLLGMRFHELQLTPDPHCRCRQQETCHPAHHLPCHPERSEGSP